MVKVDSKPHPATLQDLCNQSCFCRIDSEHDAKRILRNLVEEIVALDAIAMLSSATNSDLNKALSSLRESEENRRRLREDNEELAREVVKLRTECKDLRNRVQELELETCTGPPSGHLRITEILRPCPHEPHNIAHNAPPAVQRQVAREVAEPGLWAAPAENDSARKRTEQWVWRHSGLHVEYEPLGELEGSCDSSTVVSDGSDEHCLLSLCDSESSSNSHSHEPPALPSAHPATDTRPARGRGVRQERRAVLRNQFGARQPGRKGSANKVARPPWKTSVDVNPVYSSKSIFGRLMGGIQDRAAASGVISDAVARDNIACF